MKVGILGFPGSGKTTLFNVLTGLKAEVGFGDHRKPNLGVTKVPDDRIDRLSEMYEPKKTTLAEMRYVDIAGKAPDGSGTALDQGLLTHIRDTEALVLVVRAFESAMLEDAPNAGLELENLESELILVDLSIIEKRMDRLEREGNHKGREFVLLARCVTHLEAELPLRELALAPEEELTLRGFRFLSLKPALVLINTAEDAPNAVPERVQKYCEAHGLALLALCADFESELLDLDEEEAAAFLEEYGLEDSGRDRFIQVAYNLLDLISFFTVGPDEVRAWTIERGTFAVKAAGKIHSDIEKGFIRAEVTPHDLLLQLGSEQAVKAAGKLRLEGKEYVVLDGDICHFRFNV